ncbi:cupin domain-containing protein [Pararhizobium sp. PWRC1-1]|uniref:cupin domain-containing protein n=1 Tax=Pararhizobium sp. PWRC1-1 TaxID=2804566 RepID=UPI003CF9AFBD
MIDLKKLFVCAVVAGVASYAHSASAEDQVDIKGITWTELERVPLAGSPKREEILGIAVIEPGVTVELHIHEDYEVGYLLDGEFSLETEGEAVRTFKAGDSYAILPRKAHAATSTGKTAVKELVTYIVEAGKPLAEPPKK